MLICFWGIINIGINAQMNDEDYFYLDFFDNKFIGFYLPLTFITSLTDTKNYSIAWDLNENRDYFDCLVVYEHSIRCSNLSEEGYRRIPRQEAQNFQFEYTGMNGAKIVDSDGNIYERITNDTENYYEAVNSYIGKIVLHELIENGTISIENDIITIPSFNNRSFRINTWERYHTNIINYPDTKVNLYLYDGENRGLWNERQEDLCLEIKNNEYAIYDHTGVGYIDQTDKKYKTGVAHRLIWKTQI
jgi:hypothetical protein